MTSTTRQFCTFTIGGQFFGIDVLRVQEVLKYQNMRRVPRAPGVVEGLINLRGQIVLALDMRRRLAMAERENGALPMNIIIRTESDGVVSLLVDEIGDVIEVDEEMFETPPDTLSGDRRKMVRGVYKLADRLMLELDAEQAVAINGN